MEGELINIILKTNSICFCKICIYNYMDGEGDQTWMVRETRLILFAIRPELNKMFTKTKYKYIYIYIYIYIYVPQGKLNK